LEFIFPYEDYIGLQGTESLIALGHSPYYVLNYFFMMLTLEV